MPVTTVEKVAALSRDFGSQRRLAELLELVMAHLLRLYPLEAAERWLIGANPSLGERRPVDLIRRGQAREVLDAITSERAGSFA
jgi:uncharacterized protein (DUF2384 family)